MRGRSDKAARVIKRRAGREREKGGRGSHLAIRSIEQLVSSTVVMYRLQHIQVSQTGRCCKNRQCHDLTYRCSRDAVFTFALRWRNVMCFEDAEFRKAGIQIAPNELMIHDPETWQLLYLQRISRQFLSRRGMI